jgi:hypothetical protein
LAIQLVFPGGAQAAPLDLEDFFGIYVGRARTYDRHGNLSGERDLDILIESESRKGFRIRWATVKLVEGRRDVPGVRRNVIESVFRGGDGRKFVEDARGSLFQKKKETELIAGDPLRWARIKDKTLSVYSITIIPDGRYELQIYDRTRTESGLAIRFRRYIDDTLQRSVEGMAIKVE